MQKYLSTYKHLLFWVLLVLLIFIPLYPKLPLIKVAKTFVAIRLEDLVIAVYLLLWGIHLLAFGKLKEFFKDTLNQTIILFLGIGSLSVLTAILITHSVNPQLAILHLLRRVELILLLPAAIASIQNKKQLFICVLTISFVVLSVILYGLGQQFLHLPVISTTNSEFSKGQILYLTPDARVNSTFAGHYDLAVFLMMVVVILSGMFFAFKKLLARVWVLIIGGLSFVVLVMTAARLSFLAVIVGIVYSLILSGKKMIIFLIIILAGLFLIYPSQLRDRMFNTIYVNVLKGGTRYVANQEQQTRSKLNLSTLPELNSSSSSEPIRIATAASVKSAPDIAQGEPLDTTQLGVYRSFKIRLNVEWPRALNAFYKNPLLGTGYSSLGVAVDNDFLRSLGEVGLLGTLSFVLLLWESLKRIHRMTKPSIEDKFIRFTSIGMFAMVWAFILNGLFIDVFEASKVASMFWVFLGINLSVMKFKND